MTTMPNEMAPAQMLRMALPYPERAPADTSGVVRISRFGIAFEASSAGEPGNLQWPAGVSQRLGAEVGHERACERIGKHSASANADSERQRGGRMSEQGIETPDEDAAEQAREVPEEDDEELSE